MDNYFVSSCKRVKDWICRQFGQKEKKTVHHKKFADGGEVIVWETGRAGEEAASYEHLFLRKEITGFRTNIRREQSCSIKSLTRDYLYKQLLSSGEYTFDHMLVIKDPYGEAPLTALALFILEEPACVRVTTKGNLKETDFVTELPKKKEHRVPILGMYAEKANDIVIEILDDEGNCVKSHTFTIRTKRLPKSLRNVITVKKWTEALRALGFTVLDSKTNFIFAKSGDMPGKVYFDGLREAGILVRRWDSERIKDYVRISIGSEEEMETFVEETKKLVEAARSAVVR